MIWPFLEYSINDGTPITSLTSSIRSSFLTPSICIAISQAIRLIPRAFAASISSDNVATLRFFIIPVIRCGLIPAKLSLDNGRFFLPPIRKLNILARIPLPINARPVFFFRMLRPQNVKNRFTSQLTAAAPVVSVKAATALSKSPEKLIIDSFLCYSLIISSPNSHQLFFINYSIIDPEGLYCCIFLKRYYHIADIRIISKPDILR